MALRDYLPSFMRREQEANASLLGELTPSERQRLERPEKSDPIEYWERASDKTLLSADIIKSMGISNMAEIGNGWTAREAEAMNAHMDAKAAREWERSEPSAESVRGAERMADATDPAHDERRERQANAYRTTQAQRDAARAQAAPSVRSDADRASAAAQILNVVAASL